MERRPRIDNPSCHQTKAIIITKSTWFVKIIFFWYFFQEPPEWSERTRMTSLGIELRYWVNRIIVSDDRDTKSHVPKFTVILPQRTKTYWMFVNRRLWREMQIMSQWRQTWNMNVYRYFMTQSYRGLHPKVHVDRTLES